MFDMNSQWDVDIREPEAEQLFLLLSVSEVFSHIIIHVNESALNFSVSVICFKT